METQDAVFCDKCRRELVRLETYICAGGAVLCDECYMNMSTREFLDRIGGHLVVKE